MTRRAAIAALAAVPAWARGRPRLSRTFLQPWRKHLDWTPAEWAALLDWLRALSVRELALQWTSWNGLDYGGLAASLGPELASRRMKLWLGLAFDDEFWRWGVDAGSDTSRRLRLWRERSFEQAQRLASGAAKGRWFAGWYLPEEFDADRWRAAAPEVRLHLSASRQVLSRIGGRPVVVTGFPSASAQDASAFWSQALDGGAVDELWLQDGIGSGKSTLQNWPAWATQVASSIRRTRCRLSVVVETFETVSGEGFQARPAPLDRLNLQIQTAAAISSSPLGAFAVPEYMSPSGGDTSEALGRAYAAAQGIRLPGNLPSKRPSPVR